MTSPTSSLRSPAGSCLTPPGFPQYPDSRDAVHTVAFKVVWGRNFPLHICQQFLKAKYAVAVTVNAVKIVTPWADRGMHPCWDHHIGEFNLKPDSAIEFTVIADRALHEDKAIGAHKLNMSSAWDIPIGDPRSYTWQLQCWDSGERYDSELCVEITHSKVANDEPSASRYEGPSGPQTVKFESAVADVKNTIIGRPRTVIETAASAINSSRVSLGHATEIGEAFFSLLSKIERFADVVKPIADIHPYASLAFRLLSWVPQKLAAQLQRDQSVYSLITLVDGALVFVSSAEPLKRWESYRDSLQSNVITRIVRQIVECCRFMKNYFGESTFLTRTVANTFSSEDANLHVQRFRTTINKLKGEYHGHVAINTQITVLRVLDTVTDGLRDLEATMTIQQLQRAEGAHFLKDKACRDAPGLKGKIVDRVVEWIERPDSITRTIPITGREVETAAIAHEVALRFSDCGRLGSSFFFDSKERSERRPHRLFTDIARDLADTDEVFKYALADAVKTNSALASSSDCEKLFDSLLRGPIESHSIHPFGPIVIVIGSLDASDDSSAHSRHSLLSILANRVEPLPLNFRFVVTSMPESDVCEAFLLSRTTYRLALESVGMSD